MQTLLFIIAIIAAPQEYMPSPEEHFLTVLESCIKRDDTKHELFHGCIDWHSAVHAHWAELWLYDYMHLQSDGKKLLASIPPEAMEAEYQYLLRRPQFEMPYGRAWFLQLDITAREQYQDSTFTKLAQLCFETTLQYARNNGGSLTSSRYENSSWYLYQLHQWARSKSDTTAMKEIQAIALKYIEEVEKWPKIKETTGFFAPKLLALQLLDEIDADSSLWEPIKKLVDQESAAFIDFTKHPHLGGINFSRSWGYSALYRLTGEQQYLNHAYRLIETMEEKFHQWAGNYQWYGHWVAQFGTFAKMQMKKQ